jgi:putative ABC transport system permease protein
MRRFFLKLFRRRHLERDLEAELAFHREMSCANENPIPLGSVSRIKQQSADLWQFVFFESLWRDVVYGVRAFRRSPILVFTAVVSLGLGIGVNAGIFSLAVELLLSKPSVSDPGSLVYARLGGNSHSNYPAVEFLQQSGVFADVVGENEEVFVNWNDGTETRPVFGAFTTKNYFTGLGIPVAYGRGIQPGDPDQVAVLENRFWRKHFNQDPFIVGHAIHLDGKAYTVVGILPPSHRTLAGLGYTPEVYLPRYLDDTVLAIYARLKPGMSMGEANAALRTLAERLTAESHPRAQFLPATISPIAGFARLGSDTELMPVGAFFAMLLAISGLVLLIACMNVAGLLLARASSRKKEIAIRISLGAGRRRLLQQLLVESLLLSSLGAACGLVLAQTMATLLAGVRLPLPIPIQLHVEVDWRLALYAAFLTILSTLVCGLLPARQAVREAISRDLRGERKMRLRQILVSGQIALSLIVLTIGFLFLRNLFRSSAMSPGFDVRNTVRADVHLPPAAFQDSQSIRAYVERAVRELEAIPGIKAAAAARVIPFTDRTRFGSRLTFPDTGERIPVQFSWNAVTPDFFRALDIPLHQGRPFSASDREGDHVVIVNRTFAQRYLSGHQPIGRTFLWGADGKTPYRVVGLVDDTKTLTIGEDPEPQFYQPLAQIQNDRTRIQFVLRSAIPPQTQLEAVRRVLREREPAAGLDVSTMESSIGLAFLPSQVGAAMMGLVGILGLLLTAVGLYGTMAYAVARRTHEIGVRMAMGATRRDIARMILFDSARLVVAGSAIGLVIALFVTRPLAMFLVPGLQPADPVSFMVVLVVLGATGTIASWGPVRHALAIDPLRSLRYE